MRAEIKAFEWADSLQDSDDEVVGLVLHVGPLDGPGQETFHLSICIPQALTSLLDKDGLVIGRHLLFVNQINHDRIEAFLADRLRHIDGDTWTQLAQKVGRIGYWVFEDYTPRSPDA